MNSFKVFNCEPIGGIGMPIIITTQFSKNNRWFSEFFLLIPDEECSYYQKHILCDARAINPELFKVTEEFMGEEALQQAKIKLIDHLFMIDEKNDNNRYSGINVRVIEDTKNNGTFRH